MNIKSQTRGGRQGGERAATDSRDGRAGVAAPSPTFNHRQHPINAVLPAPDVYPHKNVACQVNFHGRFNLCLPAKRRKKEKEGGEKSLECTQVPCKLLNLKKERGGKRKKEGTNCCQGDRTGLECRENTHAHR